MTCASSVPCREGDRCTSCEIADLRACLAAAAAEIERLREKAGAAEASEIILADHLGSARIDVERLGAALRESDEAYGTLTGLLRKRFPARPDGTYPDWAIEDVLREVERLRGVLREIEAHHTEQADAWRCEDDDDDNAEYHAERAAAAAKALEER